jgi:hypothetical protein
MILTRNIRSPLYRFKSRFRYDSMTFKQYQNSFAVLPGDKRNRGTLVLAKVGHVKMVLHRPINGTRHPCHCETHSDGEMVCRHERRTGGA